jgi:hypothetical protein
MLASAGAGQQATQRASERASEKASEKSSIKASEKERYVESVLPSLDYGASCWSSIALQNLGDRDVVVQVEAHRSSGALVPLAGHAQTTVTVQAAERATYRLDISGDSGSAWVKIREKVPTRELSAVIAVSGASECVVEDHLVSTLREVAFPSRNPWFSSDVDEMHGNLVSLVNVSERPVLASLCYSSGNLYSLPGKSASAGELKPICSSAYEVQIPPFGTRQFPVEHGDSSQFSMKTQGDAIVLQMLRPLLSGVRAYSVDSTIKFDGPTN